MTNHRKYVVAVAVNSFNSNWQITKCIPKAMRIIIQIDYVPHQLFIY